MNLRQEISDIYDLMIAISYIPIKEIDKAHLPMDGSKTEFVNQFLYRIDPQKKEQLFAIKRKLQKIQELLIEETKTQSLCEETKKKKRLEKKSKQAKRNFNHWKEL